jgi:hypothetical protein
MASTWGQVFCQAGSGRNCEEALSLRSEWEQDDRQIELAAGRFSPRLNFVFRAGGAGGDEGRTPFQSLFTVAAPAFLLHLEPYCLRQSIQLGVPAFLKSFRRNFLQMWRDGD